MPKFSNSLPFRAPGNLAVQGSPHLGFPGPGGCRSHPILNRILQNKIVTRVHPNSGSNARPKDLGVRKSLLGSKNQGPSPWQAPDRALRLAQRRGPSRRAGTDAGRALPLTRMAQKTSRAARPHHYLHRSHSDPRPPPPPQESWLLRSPTPPSEGSKVVLRATPPPASPRLRGAVLPFPPWHPRGSSLCAGTLDRAQLEEPQRTALGRVMGLSTRVRLSVSYFCCCCCFLRRGFSL